MYICIYVYIYMYVYIFFIAKALSVVKEKLHYLSVAVFLKVGKIHSVLTVGQIVPGDPLPNILPSLSGDLCQACWSFEVYLQELVAVVLTRTPRTHSRADAPQIQSPVVGGVVSVPAWRSSDLIGSNATSLHSKGFVAFLTCSETRRWYQKWEFKCTSWSNENNKTHCSTF